MVTCIRSSIVADVQANRSYRIAKRTVDIVVSLTVLAFALPLMVVISAAIVATSPGPVIFRHKRIGRHGRMFFCLKFRTMVKNAEKLLETDPALKTQYAESFKIDNDSRVTPLGRFLRKTSLDELPQLFNVLHGDISLIGPRPIVRSELIKYGSFAAKLLSVTPGLSGLWQVSGRSDVGYDERIQFDMRYIDQRSLLLDAKLILQTIGVVLTRRGAC